MEANLEHDAARARELIADPRFESLKRFVKDTVRNFDRDIHESIAKGVDVRKIQVLETVRRFLKEFVESPKGAIDNLRVSHEDEEVKRIKAEIEK